MTLVRDVGGAGVSPAFLRYAEIRKIAGGTPALRKAFCPDSITRVPIVVKNMRQDLVSRFLCSKLLSHSLPKRRRK
jgi:hypothetical protein